MHWRRYSALLIALAAIAAAWLTAQSELGQKLEFSIADTGMQVLQHPVDSPVVIIGIDAKSLAELREWPWPRRYHADLIKKLAPASPKRLFLDIDFSSSSSPDDDQRLQSALARWNGTPIILPAFYQFVSPVDNELVLTRPLPELRQYASIASVNFSPGIDGLVRELPGSSIAGGQPLPSAAAALSGHANAGAAGLPIDYSIDPVSFDYISYVDVIENRVPAVYFADKTILVGATAIELGDTVPVPVYQSLPGVVVQALAYETLRQGAHRPLPQLVYWVLVAMSTVLLGYFIRQRTWRQNLLVLCVALLGFPVVSLAVYAFSATTIAVLPFIVSAVTAYLLITLQSLETVTLRSIAYAIGFRRRDALLKSVVLSSTDCIICIDESGVIKTANPAADKLFGLETGKLIGLSILRFVPDLQNMQLDNLPATFASLSNRIAEFDAQTASGNSFPIDVSISRVQLNDEHLYTAIIRDISERKAQLQQLQFQATHDPLTTLPNRPALAAHLDTMLARKQDGDSVALMMIDLDRFKEVNDTLGHNVGDYVLHEVARRLAEVAKDEGFIARIGGDEFALVVDKFAETDEISNLSQQLVDCLKTPIETGGVAIDIGLSIGIALFPQDAKDAETLFKQSDVAMYVAKRAGSGFEYYDSESDHHSVRRLSVASKLRRAIAETRLDLHYQPQINLSTRRIDSVEALLRWNDPELGAVRPDEFIAMAEATDMIQPLTEWTLTEAFRQCVDWQEAGLALRVAVNLSARMLQNYAFPERLDQLMKNSGVSPDSIELEITESAVMVDPEKALKVINSLSELGVLISIDDYGTGYSSLAYLRDLPVHALKLDKSFVMNMQEHDDDRVIVESTVQMAHALGLKVVAEGVETAADATFLHQCGYDYAQGYLYSPAIPPQELLEWVRQFNSRPSRKLA